ncbi:MAG: hypothetical protein PHH77_05675 [Victivallaceae bacterium]|nr:hypothetical protein [Victivallaceae bacterium]
MKEQCFSSGSHAQHPEKIRSADFSGHRLARAVFSQVQQVAHKFRPLEMGDQRFRPLAHRPEQVLDYVIFLLLAVSPKSFPPA